MLGSVKSYLLLSFVLFAFNKEVIKKHNRKKHKEASLTNLIKKHDSNDQTGLK